ncbi:putative dNA-binding protein, partial [Chlamydia psittaci 06-1683]
MLGGLGDARLYLLPRFFQILQGKGSAPHS